MSMKYKCLIVDDEPIARQIVEQYCAYLPDIDIVGSCGDAFMAKEITFAREVDIIFLDINMPVLDGIAFLKTLRYPPQVIFTTAYKEYALNAFDLAACDYLLKPFSLDRFIIAVDKSIERISGLQTERPKPGTEAEEPFFFPEGGWEDLQDLF